MTEKAVVTQIRETKHKMSTKIKIVFHNAYMFKIISILFFFFTRETTLMKIKFQEIRN